MSVADYMTKKVITISPDTKINVAINVMKDNQIHRLPVIDGAKLVGIVTEGIIQEASPSKATSLSIYEVNYLFNKMTVKDVMEKDVKTIEHSAQLEDAISTMRHNHIGVLPVMDGTEVVGIITTNDILDGFLDITDYFVDATVVQVMVEHDRTGVIYEMSKIMADNGFNIQTLIVTRNLGTIMIEMHVDKTDGDAVKRALEAAGYEVRLVVNQRVEK
ncbi:acetoin utilization probable CBS domain protein [Secundilactobacillus odoratitofui DSM 19909 = JCM 15043]|uniref:Acetoin utilization probable CBS domain protein n=1 Tax=Secundilactobacillus odoratitofui DSM 19909 = JCM 15043 TaxID=1423776 RepID=A0A0R1M1I9_9LACO|nr:CBS and ACT domain-containing protein [Secundilactobacillus odoratitofui]KRK98474.1 acetoin utilization probable CBS domain protein [Secundilactobacillus odoratitofui DSM 19909 = JCM 15043]